jgi:hypothetical protein
LLGRDTPQYADPIAVKIGFLKKNAHRGFARGLKKYNLDAYLMIS